MNKYISYLSLILLFNFCFCQRYLGEKNNDISLYADLGIGTLQNGDCVYMKFNTGRNIIVRKRECIKMPIDENIRCWDTAEGTIVEYMYNDVGYGRKIWNFLEKEKIIKNIENRDDCKGTWTETHILGDISFGGTNVMSIGYKNIENIIVKLFDFKNNKESFDENIMNNLKQKLWLVNKTFTFQLLKILFNETFTKSQSLSLNIVNPNQNNNSNNKDKNEKKSEDFVIIIMMGILIFCCFILLFFGIVDFCKKYICTQTESMRQNNIEENNIQLNNIFPFDSMNAQNSIDESVVPTENIISISENNVININNINSENHCDIFHQNE